MSYKEDLVLWRAQGLRNKWKMPTASLWRRLPVIRHFRAIAAALGAAQWYANGPGMIGIPTGYDDWVLWGMWHGLERDEMEDEL